MASPLDPMPEPQPVLAPLTKAAVFLVVRSTGGPGADARLLQVSSDVNTLVKAVGFREAPLNLSCVVSFGSEYWDRIRPGGPRPAQLHPFRPVAGEVHVAIATAGDVLFHIRADRSDLSFELAKQLMIALDGAVEVLDCVQGFRYFDARDLLGFVDGTENPAGRDADSAVLISADVEPDFAGGSYVIVQKYLHDMAAWDALEVSEQERIIGRSKLEDIELPDEVQPSNSHVSLNSIVDDDGVEHEILRDNMPFGDPGAGEFGTYFIGYAADVSVTELMMERMFVGDPPGNYDRILDFSTPVTGTLFFTPSRALLEQLDQPTEPAAEEGDSGALTIGSLKGEPQ